MPFQTDPYRPGARRSASLRATQWLARAPRALAATAAIALVAAGVRAAVVPSAPSTPGPKSVTAMAVDPGYEGFAESFVRSYLTWDGGHPGAWQKTLHRYGSTNGLDGAVSLRPGDREAVRWTTVVGNRPIDRGRIVTVEAATGTTTTFVSVRILRGVRGLSVVGYPAIVGGPRVDPSISLDQSEPVDDSALRATARRALSNYLAGHRDELSADVSPGAVVVLPRDGMRVQAITGMSWTRPAQEIDVVLSAARSAGPELTLEYLLDVDHRARRWFVSSIESSPPPTQEVHP